MNKKVKTRIWQYSWENFIYPEDEEALLKDKDSIGVAFSGGGTRSASLTIGQLKALKEIGLLDKIKYISAVSGGGWATIPFTFLPDKIDDDKFFGTYDEPENLSKAKISKINKTSFQYVLSETEITRKFLYGAILKLEGDEAYSRTLGRIFLEPYKLEDYTKFFTYNKKTLDAAIGLNTELKRNNFYLAKEKRPFLIIGATILDHEWFAKSKKFHIEYTPYYSGVRNYFDSDEPVGGGYINSYAYDSREPVAVKNNIAEVYLGTSAHIFSLSDMMGSTGAAPRETLDKFMIRDIGFPEFRHWSPKVNSNGSFNDFNEFAHADGGALENLGIMPLLAREVKNIIVFMNSKTQFEFYDSINNDEIIERTKIGDSIKTLFMKHNKFEENIVLEGREKEYIKILRMFNKCQKQRKPLVAFGMYNVKQNHFYGIRGNKKVNIIWFYNSRVETWKNRLHDDFRYSLNKSDGLINFPTLGTFFENCSSIIDLTKVQAVLLSNFSYWNVKTAKNIILENLI